MKNMRTVTRNIFDKKLGKPTMRTFKIHPCEGSSARDNKPCNSPGHIQVGNAYYCGFHHPDKSKRRLSAMTLWQQRNGKGSHPNKPFPIKEVAKAKIVIGRHAKRYSAATPVTPIESNASKFADSFNGLVKEAVRKALLDLLVPSA